MNVLTPTSYMEAALALAERGRYSVSPNPMVGCVLVKNERIIGQGYHQRAGEAHAEIHALQEAGEQARDAIAYVSLEPCAHHGRTPPCTDALIKAGIKTVYIACLDPNPLVAGKGVAQLQAAGLEVHVGLCEAQAKKLNAIFFHYITTRQPFVVAKWAMSLDGKMSVNAGDSRQLSGQEASQHTHQLRHQFDAILIGANTLRTDNPMLTVRHQPALKQPLRVVLSTEGELPQDFHLMNGSLPGQTLIATANKNVNYPHCEKVVLPKDKFGQICLQSLLFALGERQITSLLVEGGQTVHHSFFRQNLVNQISVYVSPVIIGTTSQKKHLPIMQVEKMGDDFHITSSQEISSHV